ncbi:excisionase family DNA binding protein [Dysgonomonas sp. PH5-45]|uniref:helix-turn-helix domain-containing protein n=1 Tax=unclassified Dysgonomonas TaxID=2630389 RepID=UPI002475C372|nr:MULTISPECIES: helix-turn-helix domain-containing protein [unclassified Dysgonomonas]MDH6354682.1 excisionase family DNA binding protein [Dysgonomonas sp. PH5-45]MDH6387579.1 excisionase family DNA binding protein [Dysgonomonas sp. PH5-37]
MIGRSEHSDSMNGYSLREEKAKEKYYEGKKIEIKTSVCDISLKRWLSETEACLYTSFGVDTLRDARDMNKLPFRKMGKRIIYEKKDLDTFMEQLEFHKNGTIRNEKRVRK